jgi:hypothetical protein
MIGFRAWWAITGPAKGRLPALLFIACAALLLQAAPGHAAAVDDQRRPQLANPARATIHFDIPSQPLENALIVYADLSEVEVFIDHALAAGQYSNALQGEYSAESALRALLAGTGLQIRRAAERAYTVVAPAMQEPAVGWAPAWESDHERGAFFAALQASIINALCMRSGLIPGQHRIALAIWIDPAGQVTDGRILTSQIPEEISVGIVRGIRNVAVGQPLPPGLKQPVTLVILAKSLDRSGDCAALRSGRG